MIGRGLAASRVEIGPKKGSGELRQREGLSEQEDLGVRRVFMVAQPSRCVNNPISSSEN